MRRRLMLSLILLGICGQVGAQQSPIVRVSVTPETVSVGESAELRVTVLVPTWFPRPPVYPAFELANAITRLPADSSYPVSPPANFCETKSPSHIICQRTRISGYSAAEFSPAAITWLIMYRGTGSSL